MAIYTSNVTLRRDAGLSVMQFALSQNFVAQLVAPDLPMETRAGTYKKMVARTISQLAETKASNQGGPKKIQLEIDQDNYFCDKHWLDLPLSDTERAELAAGGFDPYAKFARVCAQALMLREEYDLAATLFNTTTFPLSGTTGLSVSVPWATSATATPIDDIAAGTAAINKKTGVNPDTLLVTQSGAAALSRCAQITDRIKYIAPVVQNGVLANPALAAVLGLKQIIVASAVYNSADQGQTMSGGYVWNTDNAMLFCSTPMQRNPETGMLEAAVDAQTPQLIRTLTWSEDGLGGPMDAYPVRDEEEESTNFRTKRFRHQKVSDSNFGFLFGNLD